MSVILFSGCSPSDNAADQSAFQDAFENTASNATDTSQSDSQTISTQQPKATLALKQLQRDYLDRDVQIAELTFDYLAENCNADPLLNNQNTKLFKGFALALNYFYMFRLDVEYGVVNQQSYQAWTSEFFSKMELLGDLTPQQTVLLAKHTIGNTSIPAAHRDYLGTLAAKLLSYEPEFTQRYSNPAIKQQLDQADKIDISLLQKLDFPLHADACLLNPVLLNNITWQNLANTSQNNDYDDAQRKAAQPSLLITPEAYFYSFWLRRAQEDNTEHAKQLLQYALTKLDCCEVVSAGIITAQDTSLISDYSTIRSAAPLTTDVAQHTRLQYNSAALQLFKLSHINVPNACTDTSQQQDLLHFINGLGIAFYYYYDVALPYYYGFFPPRSEAYTDVTRPNLLLTVKPDRESLPAESPDPASLQYLNANQTRLLVNALLKNITLDDSHKTALLTVIRKLLEYRQTYAHIYGDPQQRANYQRLSEWQTIQDDSLQLDQDICYTETNEIVDVTPEGNYLYRDYSGMQPHYYLFSFWLRRYAEGSEQQAAVALETAQAWLQKN